ncbi:MAG: glycerol-3-phosphate acyltransferase [Actinobacteria bacterium]|nr:glycerol-3-phosphate acyltransferase [Actinomycetota bacterium]
MASGVAVIAVGFLAGAIPFSNLFARRARGVDLRDVGTGTVSGTALYEVAGFVPLALAGILDVAKGSLGVLLAGRGDHPLAAALAGGAAVAGHNWSPFLKGAGGRGISPALGAFLAWHWPGTIVLAIGVAVGRLVRQTGLGSFLADLALVPALAGLRGADAAWAGAAVLLPLLAKRVIGNDRPVDRPLQTYAHRLVFDNDGSPAP